MNASPARLLAQVGGSIPSIAVDGGLARAIVATLVVGGWMALGAAFRLSAEGYLLLGIPIMIAFQVVIARRPLRALWLRQAPPMTFSPTSIVAIVVVAIPAVIVAARGVQGGDPVLALYGGAATVGAVGAVYAMRAMDRDAVRTTVHTTLITGAVLVSVMVAYRIASGGSSGNLSGAVVAAVISVATYLPVVFVLEEVFFRGLLDPYLQGSSTASGRASALYGSALWGIWHLPVASVDLGALTIPYLIAVHTVIGYPLVTAWRRTGNLAVPGIAHTVIDALRNGVAVA